MKVKLFVLTMLLATFQLASAQRYICKDGHIWFYSHTPVEDIEAHNNNVVSILNVPTGDLAIELLVKSFEFKKALMQEHFNEEYLESDKFPKASFKGKITNIDQIDLKKDGTYSANVSGELTMHGVTNTIKTTGTLVVKNGSVNGKSTFIISPKDYNIEIPSIVEKNIAKEIEVNVDLTYKTN
jgi:polyisoprenoid-binding protein YceI